MSQYCRELAFQSWVFARCSSWFYQRRWGMSHHVGSKAHQQRRSRNWLGCRWSVWPQHFLDIPNGAGHTHTYCNWKVGSWRWHIKVMLNRLGIPFEWQLICKRYVKKHRHQTAQKLQRLGEAMFHIQHIESSKHIAAPWSDPREESCDICCCWAL